MNNRSLHLSDLTITGFRGIDHLSIPHLGRVTLLAGYNSVGKTTVLDAVRIYAARGRAAVLRELLRNREELTEVLDDDGHSDLIPNASGLFHGRDTGQSLSIAIGPQGNRGSLRIKEFLSADWSEEDARLLLRFSSEVDTGGLRALKIEFKGKKMLCQWDLQDHRRFYTKRLRAEQDWPQIKCESIGPALLDNQTLTHFWDNVALMENEQFATEALKIVLGNHVERVAAIGDENTRGWGGRRVVVKLDGHSRPVPLRSLGDGAGRLLGIALALANSRNGFLLIDEAENGIHHTAQLRFWQMILQTAQQHNIQVLATTHSFDCVSGFAQAAAEDDDVEGVLVRLERDGEGLHAIAYSEQGLKTAAEQGIEVR